MSSSSSNYASVAQRALSLIASINGLRKQQDSLMADASALGLNLARVDGETNSQFLARLAANATEYGHDLAKQEALAKVAAVTAGTTQATPQTPQTWLGRKLASAAILLG